MYKLPVADAPTLEVGVPVKQRLEALMDILHEEVAEIAPIIQAIDDGADDLDILTALADLLGDMQVYCASEMVKFGIPIDTTLGIIMQSNFSKLGADGKPIYDERGKVQKGPGYWKPEPAIKEMLDASLQFDAYRKGE
jgi:predicted HAD superfamily Cof-like phosphohydrolase